MKRTKGALWATIDSDARTLGLQKTEPHVQHVIGEFLTSRSMTTVRWIQMPKGVLILATLLNDRECGAIFVYDREKQEFHQLSFAGCSTPLCVEELWSLSVAYKLIRYAEKPALLKARVRAAHRASGAASLTEPAEGGGNKELSNAA